MSDQSEIWRTKLEAWLTTHPRTMPDDQRRLLAEFTQRFPMNQLGELTLEQYALGHPKSRDSFCFWLERKTESLGSIRGGDVKKFGVWWDKGSGTWNYNKMFKSAEDALDRIKAGLVALINSVQEDKFDALDSIGSEYLGSERRGMRAKPLYMYFPDQFLPISNLDHLRQFIRLFDAQPEGDVISCNRQLLNVLKQQPEFGGLDTQQMMHFLYDSYSPKEKEWEQPRKDGQAIWKIAPGEGARYWPMCERTGCIVVHWLDDTDFRSFANMAAIRQALEAKGEKTGGTAAIWKFAHDIQPGDLVVANNGEQTVVGVGVVKGDYLAPADPENPSEDSQYRHSRLVDWLITRPVKLPFRLGQQALHQLGQDKWSLIKAAYLEAYPDLKETLERLAGGGAGPEPAPEQGVPWELKPLLYMTTQTRNLIFFGPPGTGKTWLANHFANYFLLHDNCSQADANAYWQQAVEQTGSGDAPLLTMLKEKVQEGSGVLGQRTNYWWITSNPRDWTWSTLFEKGEELFTKRQIPRNYGSVKPGDMVFGYSAAPDKQMVAIARVKRALHLSVENGEEAEGILIEPVEMLTNPLAWQEIIKNHRLAQSEPVRQNARGTLFRLTPPEARELIQELQVAGNEIAVPHSPFIEFVSFHQSLAYEEFVEGLRPIVDEHGSLGYHVDDGVFKRMCQRAKEDPEHKYVLVIDEINRANIAKVFGELITLIEDDKRLRQRNEIIVTLPYSKEAYGVPENLYIFGTMNTADRSIALLDLALRRRFAFWEIMPDPDVLKDRTAAGVDLGSLLLGLNQRIAAVLDQDHQIGHGYLIDVTDLQSLHYVWYQKVLPLLREYFYSDGRKLQAVLGSAFVRQVAPPETLSKSLLDSYGTRTRYEIVQLTGEAFIEALGGLVSSGANEETE